MCLKRCIIDIEHMSIEEITILINELCTARKRKQEAQDLKYRMYDLLNEAHEKGFCFTGGASGDTLDFELTDIGG